MQVFDFEYYNHAIRRLATKHAAFQLLIRRFTEYLHLHIIKYTVLQVISSDKLDSHFIIFMKGC